MKARGGRGFTLFELLIVGVITGVMMTALWTWIGDRRDEIGHRDAALSWRAQAAGAFARLADDARGAQRIEITPGALRLGWAGAEDVTYALEDGGLTRRGPEGALALARGVEAFTATRDGARLILALDFAGKRGAWRGEARHTRTVALRVAP
jgi:type II secretory pathway pseudopilin PulG